MTKTLSPSELQRDIRNNFLQLHPDTGLSQDFISTLLQSQMLLSFVRTDAARREFYHNTFRAHLPSSYTGWLAGRRAVYINEKQLTEKQVPRSHFAPAGKTEVEMAKHAAQVKLLDTVTQVLNDEIAQPPAKIDLDRVQHLIHFMVSTIAPTQGPSLQDQWKITQPLTAEAFKSPTKPACAARANKGRANTAG